MHNTFSKISLIAVIFICTGCGGGSSGAGTGSSSSSSSGGNDQGQAFSLQAESIVVTRIEDGATIEAQGLPAEGATVNLLND